MIGPVDIFLLALAIVCPLCYPAKSLGIAPSSRIVWPEGLQERNQAPQGSGAWLRRGAVQLLDELGQGRLQELLASID